MSDPVFRSTSALFSGAPVPRTSGGAPLPGHFANAPILIVDDQQTNVDILRRMLANYGLLNLDATTDSREVADMYRRNRYDLVLLDLRMPHLDGFEVLAQLRAIEAEEETTSYLPVLVVTAQDDMPTRLRALEEGAQDFLIKPFVHAEVFRRVCNMLEVRLLHKNMRDQNRVLEARVRERTRELHDTRLEIIRRLGKAVDYRDNETGNHVVRMSQYCARLAMEIGWDPVECDLLLDASPMHDIGKIGIPDRILLKPGKLDAEEWEIMKTHTTIGAKILEGHPSELLRMAHDIALTHHEWWDGNGYPAGMAGRDIPLAGRIVSICDMFDALCSERPYKKAWPVDEAVAELNVCAGRQLDPYLVEAFQACLPDIKRVQEHYADPSAHARPE
ncbi:MAG: response regulator [Nitrospirota bacterium]|nr:response regulator [Nitrospirota bacterium]